MKLSAETDSHEPAQIIFTDEPTGALNSQAGRKVMNLIQHFHREGASILLVTHDASVTTYADTVLLILDGKLKYKFCLTQLLVKLSVASCS